MNEHSSTGSEGRARTFPVYQTPLGDALLPGDSLFARQLRSRFSEMLVKHLDAGGAANLVALGETLAAFTPADLLADSDPYGWNKRNLRQWEEEHRPQIFAALEAFFLDGGHENRVDAQREFLRELHGAGVTIEGATLLEGRIAYAGDWHDTFLHTVQTGRKHGIRLYGGSINFGLLILSMRKAGFTTLQARLIKDNIHPAAEHPMAGAPRRSTWLARLFGR